MRFISEARRVIYDGITIGTNDFLRGHFLLAESQRSNFHLFGAKAAILSHRVAPALPAPIVCSAQQAAT